MKGLTLVLTIALMSTLFSCGASKNTDSIGANSNASTVPNTAATGPAANAVTPVVVDGVQAVLAGDFAGTWSGYLNYGYTTIVINPNGSIVVTVSGSAAVNRILTLQNSVYKIFNTKTKVATTIRLVDGVMLITNNGKEEPFNRN